MNRMPPPPLGFTLIELVAVVALTSTLMLVAMALMRSVLDWGEAAIEASATAASVDRMEHELRQQLSMASSVAADERELTVTSSRGDAVWTLNGETCQLQITSDDGVRSEQYEIGRRAPWKLVTDQGLIEVRLDAQQDRGVLPLRIVVANDQQHAETQP